MTARSAPAFSAGVGLAVALLVAAAGCAPTGPGGSARATLVVYAAASLAEPFAELARAFEAAHPGTAVRASYLGSQQLAAQLAQGAPADVFAAADARAMEIARRAGRLAAAPVPFARNGLVVVVPRAGAARVRRLADLARPGVKLVLAAPEVPAGRYARQALARLDGLPGFGPGFARRALANVVSEEENVKAVLGKVELGEADAGFVYRSDVGAAAARNAAPLALPAAADPAVSYPIAPLAPARSPGLARAFVALVLSPGGQRVLAAHGFVPVGPTTP